MHPLLLWWQGSAASDEPVDAYLQDFVWVPSDLFLAVDSDERFAWVPAPSDREVER